MPISTKSLVRGTTLLLVVGLLALACIVGTSIWLVESNQAYFDEVVQARDARTSTVDLLTALQDAETGQRGFVITGDPSYLEPYDAATAIVGARLDDLAQVLTPYPQADEPMQTLREDVAFKLSEMARTVALVRAGDRDAAVALIQTDAGKAAMDRSRAFLNALVKAADERLTTGVADQRNASVALRWVTVIGAFIIFAVVAGAVWSALVYTREIIAARREVEIAKNSLEQRVTERTADLGRANEEIQRFAYIVTHDLRAPLVNIMGFTSELETNVAILADYMAKSDAPPDDSTSARDDGMAPSLEEARQAATEDLPEAITFIRAATRKMDGLINAILKISREGRRQLKPETLDLPALVKASADAIHHQVSDNDGEITANVGVPRLVSDRLSLEQILGNLLDNAVKYRHADRPLAVAITARTTPGNRVAIDIADNGRGIAASDHERVFELFRRSGTQSQPGEGIGLAHVRTLVRSLGGDITLTSELGEGTTFTIDLPRDLRSFIGS